MKMKMKMNGMRTAVLAVCTLAVSALPVMAQEPAAPPPPPAGQQGPGGPGGGHRDPARMEARQLQMMTERLKLTPEQVTQAKAIEDGQRTQMMAMRQQDGGVPQDQKRAKMMAMRQETEGKIRDVLTDEQKPKFDQMLAKQRERMEHREGGPGGPPPPPAPPQ